MNTTKEVTTTKSKLPSQQKDQKEKSPPERRVKTVLIRGEYHGPLPPPSMLAEYDKALPGVAERIISMWEREAKHRHGIQTGRQTILGGETKRGQWFTFITSIVILGIGGYIAATGHSGAGYALIIPYLAGLAGLYIYGKERNIRLQKNNEVIEIESESEEPIEE